MIQRKKFFESKNQRKNRKYCYKTTRFKNRGKVLERVALKLGPKIGEIVRNYFYNNTRSKICSLFLSTVLQIRFILKIKVFGRIGACYLKVKQIF